MADEAATEPATDSSLFQSVLTDADVSLMMATEDLITQSTYLTTGLEISQRLQRYQQELSRLDEVKRHILRTRRVVRYAPINSPRDFSSAEDEGDPLQEF